MSRQDEDLQMRQVSGPPLFRARPTGAVLYAPISFEGAESGALWFAEDQSQDAAGVIYPRDDDAAAALGVWSAALRDAKAAGLSPRDAVTGLLGTKRGRGSVVGSELSRIDDLSTIVERFRPEVVASREQGADRHPGPGQA